MAKAKKKVTKKKAVKKVKEKKSNLDLFVEGVKKLVQKHDVVLSMSVQVKGDGCSIRTKGDKIDLDDDIICTMIADLEELKISHLEFRKNSNMLSPSMVMDILNDITKGE